MKKICLGFLLLAAGAQAQTVRLWHNTQSALSATSTATRANAVSGTPFSVAAGRLHDQMSQLSDVPEEGQLIEFPAPDGSVRAFRTWNAPMMEPALAARHPEIQTFSGVAASDPRTTAKFDWTPEGFHGMVFSDEGTYFIEPDGHGGYISYYKTAAAGLVNQMVCQVEDNLSDASIGGNALPGIALRSNGATRKTYRLALACTGEYAVAVAGSNPTKSAVLAKMATSMNRVNGVYERELGVHMNLIANEDTLIFLSGSTDPYDNNDGGTMLGQNQTTVTNRIGSANYDIGHVFSTGGGGIASLGSVCSQNQKAQGVTGSPTPTGDAFDIDYVAHEMGHQFGANHTFNANTGSCLGNGVSQWAYEPGSGTTIMAYAGICGSADNTQAHSDPYFHLKSLYDISSFLTTGGGNSCAVATSANNTPPALPNYSASYSIPWKTPFELTAPAAVDPDNDTITYCWEEWDLGDFKASWPNQRFGPIFRSFKPTTSRTRIFPALARLLNNNYPYLGEKLPDTNRLLTFRVTVRDVYNGKGTFYTPDTGFVKLNVINTGVPFAVTSPNTAVTWQGGSYQTVTWDTANTKSAPISCPRVNILLSTNGGTSFDVTLASGVANNGSYTVAVPNRRVTSARIKVQAANNVFFDISNRSFTIDSSAHPLTVNALVQDACTVFPVPAKEQVQVSYPGFKGTVTIDNLLGQPMYAGKMEDAVRIPVRTFAPGTYLLRLQSESGERVTRTIVVE